MESLGLAILCMWSMGAMFLLYKSNCKLIEERRKENEEMNGEMKRDRKYKKYKKDEEA